MGYLSYSVTPTPWQALLDKHKDVFKEELGTVTDITISLRTKSIAQTKFFRTRPVPFALKETISAEIDRLEPVGILDKVDSSEWATPIVPVLKDGKLRIFGDYRVTVNPALDIE